jgi:anti-sigma factor (TIGR02949 family)
MTDSNDKPVDMDCIHALEFLYAYLDGELDDPAIAEQVEHHLGHCKSCYARTEVEQALTEHAKSSQKLTAPERLQDRLRNLLDEL